jgi:hypothetical protein
LVVGMAWECKEQEENGVVASRSGPAEGIGCASLSARSC